MVTAIIIVTVVFVVISIIVTVVSFTKFKSFNVKSLLEKSQKMIDENEEALKNLRQSLKNAGFDEKAIEEGKVMCEYCGGLVDKDAYKCPNCGAVKNK